MKILYRDHRGTLDEAMKTMREYRTVDELKAGLAAAYNKLHHELGYRGDAFAAEDVSISDDLGPDDRIGWPNTHYVCIRRMGDDDFVARFGSPQAIGFCAFFEGKDELNGYGK